MLDRKIFNFIFETTTALWIKLKNTKCYFESKAKSGFDLLIDTGLCLEKTDLTCCGGKYSKF